jgi:ABC-2 type transport system ATP-binding protein
VLEVHGVEKRYGPIEALRGLSLSVRPGEIAGLVGHNGAGKSTLVDVIGGLTRPDAGDVRIGRRAPRHARHEVGIAPQVLGLYPGLTAREHLTLFGRLAGLRRRALTDALDEVAEALELTGFLDRRAGLLSGGQQRRTQAATALLHRPGLLILDEPTAGADPQTRRSLLAVVRARADQGAAVLYITHYLPERTELDASIAVADRGRIVARGTADELLRDLPSTVRVRTEAGDHEVVTPDPTGCLVRLLATVGAAVTGIDVEHASLDELYGSLVVAHNG